MVQTALAGSGLSFRKTLVGCGWAFPLFLRKQSSNLVGPPLLALNAVWKGGCLPIALTIEIFRLINVWVWFG